MSHAGNRPAMHLPAADEHAARRTAAGDRPLRVLLLLSSLHGGGAERVALHLLNGLDPRRFQVTMGLLRAAGPYLAEADPRRVMVAERGDERFAFDGANAAMYRPAKLLRGLIEAPRAFRAMIEANRPDVVVSFLKGTNLIAWRALAGLAGPRPRWIAREGNNVLAVIAEETPGPLAARLVAGLTARAYRSADRVLTISSALAGDISGDLGLDPDRVAMIHNPVAIDQIRRLAGEPLPDAPRRPFVLTAGRMEVQKAHDVLLRAFAASAPATHDLVILGEGSQRAELNALAEALGLAGRVRFPGFVGNPFAWMAACDLFVLPSRWEGFGSALAEAQAAGAAVLATDCRYGPGEIVEHGTSGWLVPVDDEPALAQAMQTLLDDEALRRRLAAGGGHSVERFRLEAILARYGALFDEVAQPAALALAEGVGGGPNRR
ncbi:MAG: glycosyltransferase [Novosphingobium sp.]